MKRLYATISACAFAALVSGCSTGSSNLGDHQNEAVQDDPAIEVVESDGEETRRAISQAITEVDPYVEVLRMRASELDGWHEVHLFSPETGDQLAYVSNDAKSMLLGELIDLESGASLSASAAVSLRSELISAADGSSVTFNAPEERAVVYAFTDVDCEACDSLHEALPSLNEAGVSIRYLAFPAEGMQSTGAEELASIWCADDAAAAFNARSSTSADPSSECMSQVSEQYALGLRLGVQAVPTLVSTDGLHLTGFPGADAFLEGLGLKSGS